MSVKIELMQQYAKVMMVNESIMASGMSRLGRLASSPAHAYKNQSVDVANKRRRPQHHSLLNSPVVATTSNPMNP